MGPKKRVVVGHVGGLDSNLCIVYLIIDGTLVYSLTTGGMMMI